MTSQVRATFAVLALAQPAHSTEEYLGRLWEALLPARVVSLAFSSNPQRGFLVVNAVIVAFGVWRRGRWCGDGSWWKWPTASCTR